MTFRMIPEQSLKILGPPVESLSLKGTSGSTGCRLTPSQKLSLTNGCRGQEISAGGKGTSFVPGRVRTVRELVGFSEAIRFKEGCREEDENSGCK